MTRQTSVSPLSHEQLQPAPNAACDRVDGEYVFTAVTDHPGRDEVVAHSIRVDPAEGQVGQLVLHVTRRNWTEGERTVEHRSLTLPAPSLDAPPRVATLEARLESWYHRHCRSDNPGAH